MTRTPAACEVVAIGDELLLGDVVDTNGAWLGRVLASAGLPVVRRTTVSDAEDAIAAAVGEALDRTGCVICSGGLGPTRDDVTREAVAGLLGRTLVQDRAWLAVIEARFRERGIEVNDLTRRQAMVPEGATVLPNDRGSAPGIAIEDDRGLVVLLPGVPHELRGLVEDRVLPWLQPRTAAGRVPVLTHRIRTSGIAESLLAASIADLLDEFAPLTVAFLPTAQGVDLRLTSYRLEVDLARQRFELAERRIRERAGRFVYASGDQPLAATLGHELTRRGLTLAVAESCTGGLLSTWLTDTAGSSAFFLAGYVTYSNDAKQHTLGVPDDLLARHGAVSEPVARAMALGARAAAGVDCAMAITGIAGPGGGTPGKPVGTVFTAAMHGDAADVRHHLFRGDRAEIRARSAQAALLQLRDLIADAR